jgi:DNA-binding IclR family transcriptional regulator
MLPALLQLPRARIAASACVVYLALLEVLDGEEYRQVPVPRVCSTTGYGETAVWDSLNALTAGGFLDRRGESPRKYRLLSSQRSAVADSRARATAPAVTAPTP